MAHVTEIKVRGYHLDLYGHVNNARYLEFFEEARWAWLEQHLDVQAFQNQGLGFVAVRIAVNYRRPAALGEVLAVSSQLKHLGGRSGVVEQFVHRRDGGELVADAEMTFVVLDLAQGKAVPLEGAVRRQFERAQEAASAAGVPPTRPAS
ncbi:MAG: thioesterase family protein [Candidatus Krumholzibacteriia bacterium]